MNRKALGRGLGALIPGAPEPGTDGAPPAALAEPGFDGATPVESAFDGAGGDRVTHVALERIHPNPRQPRLEFDAPALFELAESIRAQGVLQPVLVRPDGDG